MTLPIIAPGKRALIAGSTGSGKSQLANWLLQRSPLSWVILNPKHTAAYDKLGDTITINSLSIEAVEKALKYGRYIIVNPQSRSANPDNLDAFILDLHESYTNLGLCCDELYAIHKHGVAGQGIIGWLTRGRELKQSFIGLTQRPAWLSQFLFSESDYIGRMHLSLAKDQKRMVEMTDVPQFMMNIPKPSHNWLWYDVAKEQLNYYGPVPLI